MTKVFLRGNRCVFSFTVVFKPTSCSEVIKELNRWSAPFLKSLWTPLTDLVLTSAPAFTTRVAMSSLPCLAAQCSAVCVQRRKQELLRTFLWTIVSSDNHSSIVKSRLSSRPLIGSVRGQRASCAQRGVGRMEGSVRRSDGEMVSCHLTEPNYKTTQHCAHSWGARPPVTGGEDWWC